MNLFAAVDHNLRRTEVVEEDIPGGRNPGEVLVAGNPGSSLEGIGCMDLTCWFGWMCFYDFLENFLLLECRRQDLVRR